MIAKQALAARMAKQAVVIAKLVEVIAKKAKVTKPSKAVQTTARRKKPQKERIPILQNSVADSVLL